jgi:hypothetical protein
MMYNSQYNSLQPKKLEHLCYEFSKHYHTSRRFGIINTKKNAYDIKAIITQGIIAI